MGKVLVSLSGGMDSATLYAIACEAHGPGSVTAVTFVYGSKHNRYETQAAAALVAHYGTAHRRLDLRAALEGFRSNLLEGQGPIPEGHYEDKSMALTVVPGRNLIFASVLTGLAWSLGADTVWMGMHAGDHAIYEDCRPEFVAAMGQAVQTGTGGRVALAAPFINDNKITILKRGLALGVPYQFTRTCYQDSPLSCGSCGACQERLEAFAANRVDDPLPHVTRVIRSKE